LAFPDLVAPVRDLAVGDALECWRWLAGEQAKPLLLTALGDLFAELPSGQVALLDTYEGTFKSVAADRAAWKDALRDPRHIEAWFGPGLVLSLRERGLFLADGQCYSPIHPLVLGGNMEPENFEATDWRVHLAIMGQIYEQSKDLPSGTPITGFKWK
jgi:hypothetical protein